MDYKEKLRLAKEALESGSYDKETIEYIFPELKESEDDDMKLTIIQFLEYASSYGCPDILSKEKAKTWISWLEKQGEQILANSAKTCKNEQNPANKVESKFKVGDTIIKKHNSDINKFGKFTITDIIDNKYWYNDRIICDIIEQDEWEIYETDRQNAWSEEDENLMYNTLSNLTELKDLYGKDYGKVGKCVDWPKSLKDRIKGE